MSTISGGISFSGLGSGVQFDQMIEEQKKMQSIQKNRLQYWKGDWQKRYDAFDELLKGIETLNDTLKGFNSINKILSKAVSSSSSGVATAKAAADAPEGTNSLDVSQLATNAVLTNNVVFSSKTAAVSPDKDTMFSYTYKGKTQNVRIPRGSSIQGMVDQINKDAKASKVDVSANLIKSGAGYVFQIQGNETGVANDLNINGSTTVPNFEPKTMRSTVTYKDSGSYLSDLFGPDGLKFTYGNVPDPLPPGKTAADYQTEFNYPPTIDNSWQTSGTYGSGNSALTEDMEFTHNGKNYSFSATNKQGFTSKAYSTSDPITEDIEFSYNGKDYTVVADGTKTLADAQKEIQTIGGKDVSSSLVNEIGADGKATGKKQLAVTANKVDIPVYKDPVPYLSESAPITAPISFTTPNGKTLTYDVGSSLSDVAAAINGDSSAGVSAKVVKDETLGTYSLEVSEVKQHEDGIVATSGGDNTKRTINDVVKAINADTATEGISAKMVQVEGGKMVMRVQARDGATFAPGTAGGGGANFEAAKRTLQDVVSDINAKGNSKGLSATVFTNADGTVSLDLRSNDPTAIHVGPGFAGTGPTVNTWNKRSAQDALYKMNGLDFEFSSSSNELKDVIPGLTVSLGSTGKTTFTTTTDSSKVKDNVEELVKSVNELLDQFTKLTKFDKNKDTADAVVAAGNESWQTAFAGSQIDMQKGGTLTGNYGVMLLNSQLKNIVSGMGVGFKPPETQGGLGDTFFSLNSIGIIMDSDESSATFGKLKVREPQFDDDGNRIAGDFRTLEEALEDDPLAVAQLLAGTGGVSDMPGVRFDNTLEGKTKPGTYDMKYSIDASGKIGDVYIGGQKAIRTDEANNSYTVMSGPGAGLSVSITDLAPGDYSGTIRIKQGKVAQLCETLDYQLRDEPRHLGASAKRGPLKVLQANYRDIMDNIDKKIEKEERRISQWERREKLRYSRLDTVLAQYNQRSTEVNSAMSSMPGIE